MRSPAAPRWCRTCSPASRPTPPRRRARSATTSTAGYWPSCSGSAGRASPTRGSRRGRRRSPRPRGHRARSPSHPPTRRCGPGSGRRARPTSTALAAALPAAAGQCVAFGTPAQGLDGLPDRPPRGDRGAADRRARRAGGRRALRGRSRPSRCSAATTSGSARFVDRTLGPLAAPDEAHRAAARDAARLARRGRATRGARPSGCTRTRTPCSTGSSAPSGCSTAASTRVAASSSSRCGRARRSARASAPPA